MRGGGPMNFGALFGRAPRTCPSTALVHLSRVDSHSEAQAKEETQAPTTEYAGQSTGIVVAPID
jgi:hypothetical protein